MALYNSSKNVTTAGTAVRLAATRIPATWVSIQAKQTTPQGQQTANTGAIAVGGAGVNFTNGQVLLAGESLFLPPIGGAPNPYTLNDIWINSEVNNEGVTITYFTL